VIGCAPDDNIDVVGLKIMYEQLSLFPRIAYVAPAAGAVLCDVMLRQWLKDNNVLVVHTVRRNHLKMVVSLARATQTGQFHSRDGGARTIQERIVLPPRGLIARLRRIEAAEKAARGAIRKLRVIDVWYEDYVGEKRPEVEQRLCAAMGQVVPDGGLRSPLAKVSSDGLRDAIENYDQIASLLSGTRFARFLGDLG
jgi:LPS sulfotransferase NodH